jgi:hypothetical protein
VALAGVLIALRVVLPFFDAPPALRNASPANGAGGVAPLSRIILRFDRPMNPRSAEHAIVLRPATPWRPIWSDDFATLTISPTTALLPQTNYQLIVTQQALSRRFRALSQPIELSFRTVPAPEVVMVLPANNTTDVDLKSPISIRFSRTIVPETALMHPAALPELQFDPPLSGSATWLDPATVLFRPATPLRPGTRYQATLAATLSDANGGQLSKPFSWSFSTSAPHLLALAPADGARFVAPRATLALTMSQPLALESLRASLVFSPTITGQLATATLTDGSQLITYRPDAELRPSTTYTATLDAGAAPTDGNLPLLEPVRWSFTTAPRPALTGRFPGEGQTLPSGQEIRLVFTTPMDRDSLREALQVSPPIEGLDVTSSDSEIRIRADLQAATVYTMTLPAALADRNGIPLGQDYRIRFVTAPAGPTLVLPEITGHIAQILPGRAASLLVRRTNLSALNADLYQIDEAAVVRMLGFQESDWGAFQPERYGQPLLRSWRVPLSDQLNTVVEEPLPLTPAADQALPDGAYYLRLRTLEGPRADLLLLVARARLTLQTRGPNAVIWATDIISGTPVAGLPIALYRSGALVRQGTTDASGTLTFDAPNRSGAADIAIAGSGSISGVASAIDQASQPASDTRAIFLTVDRAAYHPGEAVQLAGFVRASPAPTGTLALPPSESISIGMRRNEGIGRLYQTSSPLGATGTFSAALLLDENAPPGSYTATATVGGSVQQVNFLVEPATTAPLQVSVGTPPPVIAGEAAPVTIGVRTLEGLPVAGALISWTLDAERAPPIVPEGVIVGDAERTAPPAVLRTGAAQTDSNGQFSLFISDLVSADVPLRYRVIARAAEPGGPSAAGSGSFVVAPARRIAGLRLPSQIFNVGQSGTVDVLALTPDGQPAPRATVRVEAYRRTWERAVPADGGAPQTDELVPRDQLALTRSIATGEDGVASLPITLPEGGAYRLRASVADGSSQTTFSAATVWATAPGFSGWGELPGGAPLLIADRPSYHPGETATLLVTMPFPQATALIVRRGASGLASEVRAIRAGLLFTMTIEPNSPSQLPVSVVLATRAAGAGATAASLVPLASAQAVLRVASDRQALDVSVATDRANYAPGETATLTITTSAAGTPAPADLILAVADAANAPSDRIGVMLRPATVAPGRAPTARIASSSVPAEPEALAAPDPAPAFWSAALRTNASGVLTATVPLPAAPAQLRAIVWAASADRIGQAASTLVVTQPIGLRLIAPPSFRVGDLIELAALVENAGPEAEVGVNLSLAGLQLQPSSAMSQRVRIAQGTSARLTWAARVLDAASVRLNVSAAVPDRPPETRQLDRPIVPAAAPSSPRDNGLALLREYFDPLTGQQIDPAKLRAGQLVRARLTIISVASQRDVLIEEALPAGAQLVVAPSGPFDRAEPSQASLTLEKKALDQGIVQYEYLLRLVAGGTYNIPAPAARAAEGASGVGNAMQLQVAGN